MARNYVIRLTTHQQVALQLVLIEALRNPKATLSYITPVDNIEVTLEQLLSLVMDAKQEPH